MSDFVFLPGQTVEKWTRLERQDLARLPSGLHFKDGLLLDACHGSSLPAGLTVDGNLTIKDCSDLTRFPTRLHVGIDLEIRNCQRLCTLPEDLVVQRDLSIHNCDALSELPAGLTVDGNLTIIDCSDLTRLPTRLHVGIDLEIRNCQRLWALPKDLVVQRDLSIYHCGSLPELPDTIRVGRNLLLWGCLRIKALPDWDIFPGDLILRNSQRVDLPERLKIRGKFDITDSLTKLPNELSIGGDLIMRDSFIHEIPSGLRLPGNVVASGSSLERIGANVEIEGDLNISGSGIKVLPDDLVVRGRIIGAPALHVVQKLTGALKISDQAAIQIIRQLTDLSIEEATELYSRLVEGGAYAYTSPWHGEPSDDCPEAGHVVRRLLAANNIDSASLPPEHQDWFPTFLEESYRAACRAPSANSSIGYAPRDGWYKLIKEMFDSGVVRYFTRTSRVAYDPDGKERRRGEAWYAKSSIDLFTPCGILKILKSAISTDNISTWKQFPVWYGDLVDRGRSGRTQDEMHEHRCDALRSFAFYRDEKDHGFEPGWLYDENPMVRRHAALLARILDQKADYAAQVKELTEAVKDREWIWSIGRFYADYWLGCYDAANYLLTGAVRCSGEALPVSALGAIEDLIAVERGHFDELTREGLHESNPWVSKRLALLNEKMGAYKYFVSQPSSNQSPQAASGPEDAP